MTGPIFIALGENGLRGVSQDTVHYEQFETKQRPPTLTHALFLNGLLLACGGARYGTTLAVYRTRNGVDWEYKEMEKEKIHRAHGGFVLGDKAFVFSGISDRGMGSVASIVWSTDGENWSEEISLGIKGKGEGKTGPVLRVAAIGPDRVVAVGDFGRRMVSTDGMEWQEAEWYLDDPQKRLSLATVAYGNGAYVAAGLHGVRVTSTDGYQWDEPVFGLEGEHINNVIFDGSQFVCVGQGANYLSPDGRQWQRVETRDAPPLVTYGNGKYVGFKWPARIFTSVDALEWSMVAELGQDMLGIGFGELGG